MKDDLSVNLLGDELIDTKIALGVCGSIAAIESPKIARELRRHGALVKAYPSKKALLFIRKMALEWATAQKVVSNFTGLAEHLLREDALLIAPLTANSASKITHGIMDSLLMTLTASAIGMKKPLFLVPAMHVSLAKNPFYIEHLQTLKEKGAIVIEGQQVEDKQKIPTPEFITALLCHHLSPFKKKGKKIFITGGAVLTPIDGVRFLSNEGSGKTAITIAQKAYCKGADVFLLLHKNTDCPYSYLNPIFFEDYDDYFKKVFHYLESHSFDLSIFSAAVSDYQCKEVAVKEKISSDKLTLSLTKTEKIIDKVRSRYSALNMLVFKYEVGLSKEALLQKGKIYLKKGYQGIILNRKEDLALKKAPRAYVLGEKNFYQEAQNNLHLSQCLLDQFFFN